MASWFAPVPRAAVRSSLPAAPRGAIASQFEVTGEAPPERRPTDQPDQRFLDAYRLRKTDEYSSVFSFRRVLRGRFLNVHYQPNSRSTARVGVVVAKKLARRAVLRNLVKRICREVFRTRREALPRLDLVIRLSAPAAGASRAELREDLVALLGRLPR
jgi:ribonuclease P protein component